MPQLARLAISAASLRQRLAVSARLWLGDSIAGAFAAIDAVLSRKVPDLAVLSAKSMPARSLPFARMATVLVYSPNWLP